MLDWPNLLVGAAVGAATTCVPWAVDHMLARRSRRDEVLSAWATASKQIEILLWTPDATAADLFKLWSQYPIDRWRETLGPDDFRLLEVAHNAFHNSERPLLQVQQAYSDERQEELVRAYTARQDAVRGLLQSVP